MRTTFRLVVRGLIFRLSAGTTILSIIFAAILLSAIPQAALAAEYTVCLPVGACDYPSPEAAVNAVAAGDTIDIQTGTYVLGSTLDVNKSITIKGNDSVFDADGQRAINVTGAATNFSLTRVTIRNAQVGESGGGAMLISDGATVSIVNGIFENNRADFGGAIYNSGSFLNTNATVFSGNHATSGSGGALFTDGLGQSYLNETEIDGNTASVAGGGLAVAGNDLENVDNRSIIALNWSTISNNTALDPVQTVSNLAIDYGTWTNCGILPGGAIDPGPLGQTFIADASALSAYEITIQMFGSGTDGIPNDVNIPGRVRQGGPFGPIIATSSAFAPGGVWTQDTIHTLTFNLDQPVALIPGETYAIEFFIAGSYGIYPSPGNAYADGGLISCGGERDASDISDFAFRTFGGTPGEGSGIHSSDNAHATLVNTTVSGNVGDGALATSGGLVTAQFSTITNNSGNGTTAIPEELEPVFTAEGLVFITASILAGNGGDDCNGRTVTSGYNLIGDDTGCVFAPGPGPNVNDIVGSGEAPIDPLLGPLQDNGGRTPTHAIAEGSPALDAAGPDLIELPCYYNADDQRRVARPNGPACDIGAFELALVGPLQSMIDAAEPGATIIVPAGIYNEQISIGDDKILQGSGPLNVVIDASEPGGPAITASGSFTLDGIRVTGGSTDGNGAGISAELSDISITLNNVQLDNNYAASNGGALYLGYGSSATITGSTFSQNQAGSTGGAIASNGSLNTSGNTYDSNSADYGGAIGISGESEIIVESDNDLFTGNTASYEGGAIHNGNAILNILRDTFQSNTAGVSNGEVFIAGDGGAIYNNSSAWISETMFSGNVSVNELEILGQGGAIFNASTLKLLNSTIDTSLAGRGGGLYNSTSGNLSVTASTLRDNNANGYDTVGGAIGGAGAIEVTNSTLSGNTSIGGGGNGGGIGLLGGTARLNNVTLAYNTASGLGGPFYADNGALITISNSLLSENTGGGTNCATLVSQGYNLFQNTPCATAASDIIGEPLIALLASNGGPTQTHALNLGSPAVDAANPGQLVIELASALASSQLSFNGAASQNGGKLIPVSGLFVAGSTFASAPDQGPFDLNRSFSTWFSFQITDPVAWAGAPNEPSGDGFTFAIAANPTVLGEAGGRLGVATTPEPLGTVSVEFDTFPNGGDFGTNAIGINVGGIGDGQSVISAAQAAIPGGFDDGNIWTAWIDYQADTNRLDVRVAADGIRPELPQLWYTVDIATEVGPTGYYGFTGGTGLANATHSVTAWEFFETNCPSFDQRGVERPQGSACDIGAFEGAPIPLVMGPVTLSTITLGQDLNDGTSYPGVTDVPIIDIPIEKLTGDTFNSPSSAPLGSFPLGSFPIGSFDMQSSPLGSFPLGSFPIGSFPLGSFPLGSFPLSTIPLQTVGGWSEILNGIDGLAGAPLQTVTLERLLTLNPLPNSVASIALRDLSIQGSPLASLSLPGLSLGDTTVAELDEWAQNANPGGADSVCAKLSTGDSAFTDCNDTDTLLGLEIKGAPVSALSLSSLPLGSFPVGSFPLGSFPIGSFPLGSFPIGSFPLGSFPIGSFPLGSFPLGSFPVGSFPLGSFNLLAAPIGSFPLGSFPIGSFPLGSFEIDGKTFCEFYDERAIAAGTDTCTDLGVNPVSATLADLVRELQLAYPTGNIGSTPLGSFPLGSFPIGSFPIGSFDLETLGSPPLSLLTMEDFGGCQKIYGPDGCNATPLSESSTLVDVATEFGTLAASPLGSFPIGSFDVASLPMGSFPIGSFEVNGTPLGSFPLGSFDLIGSPLGSFPLGSFSSLTTVIDGLCEACQTLSDAAKAGVINSIATLAELALSSEFATTTLGEVLDAMTLAMLYGPGTPGDPSTLADIKDTGNLTLGQLLIAMMLKTDFPWETIALDQLDAQEFSADNYISYVVDIPLTGNETKSFAISVSIADTFLYVKGSAHLGEEEPTPVNDPVIVDNRDGTQTLGFNLVLGGFSDNRLVFTVVPPMALGDYPATATVTPGSDSPVAADNSNATLTVIPDPLTDISDSGLALDTPANVLTLGFINRPDDNDYYSVAPPKAGDRVAVFMSNPAGDNDLIMYEPLSTVERKGQIAEASALDSVPFEDDGINFRGNLSEEPDALEDINLAAAPLASISTNRGGIDEAVSAIAGNTEPFIIQVSGYNGAVSEQPYTLRVKVTPQVPSPQCSARTWPGTAASSVLPAGEWMPDTNAVFLVNGARLAASDPGGPVAADEALTAINMLVDAPGITNGVVVDVSDIYGVNYSAWDANPCDVDAPNSIVNAITQYLEEQRLVSPNLAYVTIVGSDEVIPFARKPDETSISNESTFAGEFKDNALYGALVTRHFLSDDTYGDIDPVAWLDRYLNVPELGVGRLVESAGDIRIAADNYRASSGILDPRTALSAGYDFIADASTEIDDTFIQYGPTLGYAVKKALIDQPGITATDAWTGDDFLKASGVNTANPVDLVSFNMHFDFDEALPSIGDASEAYADSLLSVHDLDGVDLTGGIWFTVGCHSGTSVADVSVVGAPSQDWAQTFGRNGALYLAQNAYGLGDTEAIALTERLMANFARNLNGRLTIGQAHAFAKQQYFADLGLYGEYDFKALQAATLFGLPMYQYGLGASVADPVPPALPVAADPISGLESSSWSLPNTGITETRNTSKGDLFSVGGEVQFVHFRPLQPIVRRDVTGPNGEVASGAFLTGLVTEDKTVTDIAFARPVIDLGKNEAEIESDEVVFPTTFTNIANFKAPAPGGGPFEQRQQLNVIVGQFTSPPDGGTSGTERLFRSFGAQVFYRPATSALTAGASFAGASTAEDYLRPEFDNVQASVVGSTGAQQAAFSVDVSDEGTVVRVAVLYLQSVSGTPAMGHWVLVDLVRGAGSNTWTGGGPVDLSGMPDGQIDYMVQAVDSNGNVANSTFKGLFYVAKELPPAPPVGNPGNIGVVVKVDGDTVNPGEWITDYPVLVQITDQVPEVDYEYSVDSAPFEPLTPAGFQINQDGVHIVTVRETGGGHPVSFVVLIDTTPPQALITTPKDGGFIVQGQAPMAEFDCLDAGSGITSCIGTVPDGAPVPAATTGSHSFVVTAQDDAQPDPVVATHAYFVVKPLEVTGLIEPTASDEPVMPVTISASATDLAEFTETVTIDWGDGSPPEPVDLGGGSVSNVTGNHVYAVADVYQVSVTVDYEGQFTQVGVIDLVMIFDPDDHVSGKGSIDSPSGAYTPNDSSDPDVTGPFEFDFDLMYKFEQENKGKGKDKEGMWALGGRNTFKFSGGGLELEAVSYDWMIIKGATASFMGDAASKNSNERYKFRVIVLDAATSGAGFDKDRFRIRVWQQDAGGSQSIVYDNGLGVADGDIAGGTTPLSNGMVKIHKPKMKK